MGPFLLRLRVYQLNPAHCVLGAGDGTGSVYQATGLESVRHSVGPFHHQNIAREGMGAYTWATLSTVSRSALILFSGALWCLVQSSDLDKAHWTGGDLYK